MDGSSAFEAWFKGSTVTKLDGNAQTVFHGTRSNIQFFLRGQGGLVFFSECSTYASRFAGDYPGSNVVPVYLQIRAPIDLTHLGEAAITRLEFEIAMLKAGVEVASDWEEAPAWRHLKSDSVRQAAIAAGMDGFIFQEGGGLLTYAVFECEQIKSAVGNSGAYSALERMITG